MRIRENVPRQPGQGKKGAAAEETRKRNAEERPGYGAVTAEPVHRKRRMGLAAAGGREHISDPAVSQALLLPH